MYITTDYVGDETYRACTFSVTGKHPINTWHGFRLQDFQSLLLSQVGDMTGYVIEKNVVVLYASSASSSNLAFQNKYKHYFAASPVQHQSPGGTFIHLQSPYVTQPRQDIVARTVLSGRILYCSLLQKHSRSKASNTKTREKRRSTSW